MLYSLKRRDRLKLISGQTKGLVVSPSFQILVLLSNNDMNKIIINQKLKIRKNIEIIDNIYVYFHRGGYRSCIGYYGYIVYGAESMGLCIL